ncbi:MAG: TonB family protein, partial [Verrucomicrobiales bacterium]
MHSFLHALNIGTLAAWLSVTGAGSIALVVKSESLFFHQDLAGASPLAEGGDFDLEEMSAGSSAPSDPSPSTSEQAGPVDNEVATPPFSSVPELPDLAESAPLPTIPDLPAPVKAEAERATTRPPVGRPEISSRGSNRPSPGASSGSGSGSGSGSTKGRGSGSVGSARWAGGRMPAPNYPSEARRKNQEGRVVVAFSVDERGDVVSASVSNPCPYPLLNEEALRA